MAVYDLATLLPRLSAGAVVVLGDVMLDRFVYGAVDRISPEAPIPVMTRLRTQAMLGGAGNVARNLAALGVPAALCGFVGADEDGETLANLLAEAPGLTGRLVQREARPTTAKTRYIAGGQQLLRLDVEDAQAAEAGDIAALLTGAAPELEAAGVILISDYAKGAVTDALLSACRELCARTGAQLVIDPKGPDLARYGLVDLIKPNAKELSLVTGLPIRSDTEAEAALEASLSVCAARAILVTRAAAGMSLMVRGEPVRHFPGRPRQVFDVSGAGDTALAALGAALAAGETLPSATAFALLASGLAVCKSGTAVVTPDELLEAQRQEEGHDVDTKILNHEGAAARVLQWRAQGARIGFTNGCFDILHRGHVSYLGESRRRCDRLVVALNTDLSVQRLKGAGRPVNDLESRALVLAGLGCVDLVVPFADDTPLELIRRLQPDILMKGADYAESDVVGASDVRAHGGEVALIPLIEGYSTSATLGRWRQRP